MRKRSLKTKLKKKGGGGVSARFWSLIPQPCELGMTSSGYPFRMCNAPCRIGNRQRKKKEKKNHSDCVQLGSQLTRCATSSQLRLQKFSVGGTTTDLEYPNTQYNDWGRPSVGHLDYCRDRPERFWGLVVFMKFKSWQVSIVVTAAFSRLARPLQQQRTLFNGEMHIVNWPRKEGPSKNVIPLSQGKMWCS